MLQVERQTVSGCFNVCLSNRLPAHRAVLDHFAGFWIKAVPTLKGWSIPTDLKGHKGLAKHARRNGSFGFGSPERTTISRQPLRLMAA